MSVTVSNIIQGPATLWSGIVGVTEPSSGAVALGAGWADSGGTSGGATLEVQQSFSDMEVDQIAMAVGAKRTKLGLILSTSLAEATLANLALATNGPIPVGTKIDFDPLITNANDVTFHSFCLQGFAPGGTPRRAFLRRGLCNANVSAAYKKDGLTLIPVTFAAYYVSASVKAFTVDDTP